MALSYGLSPLMDCTLRHPADWGGPLFQPSWLFGFGSIPPCVDFTILHTSTQSSRCTCCTPFHGNRFGAYLLYLYLPWAAGRSMTFRNIPLKMFKFSCSQKRQKGPPHLACPLLSKQDFYCYLGLLKRKHASLRQSFFLFPVNFRIDMHHNVFYLRKCLFQCCYAPPRQSCAPPAAAWNHLPPISMSA